MGRLFQGVEQDQTDKASTSKERINYLSLITKTSPVINKNRSPTPMWSTQFPPKKKTPIAPASPYVAITSATQVMWAHPRPPWSSSKPLLKVIHHDGEHAIPHMTSNFKISSPLSTDPNMSKYGYPTFPKNL